eukprot:SM000014S00349  [mRNA]  locus=s14:832041:845743:- [translate_table: standard]
MAAPQWAPAAAAAALALLLVALLPVVAAAGQPTAFEVLVANRGVRPPPERAAGGFPAPRRRMIDGAYPGAPVRRLGIRVPGLGSTTAAGASHHARSKYYRYASVAAARVRRLAPRARRAPSAIVMLNRHCRLQHNPVVKNQGQCDSCWALVVADAVAALRAIQTGLPAVDLAAQEICDCARESSGSVNACCNGGGWPQGALDYVATSGGLHSAADYPYSARSWTCVRAKVAGAANYTAHISGWELVPALDVHALKQAIASQPAVAFLDASAYDFQSWASSDIYAGACGTSINHAVLVVGYGVNPVSSQDYWIVRNTWGLLWGVGGYAKIAMAATGGKGACGLLGHSPLVPINDDVNACSALPNPCGSGACRTLGGPSGGYSCQCPEDYVLNTAVPAAPKCVPASPCSQNPSPCGPGVCADGLDGSYTCKCTAAAVIGVRADGHPTCVHRGGGGGSPAIVLPGSSHSCGHVAQAYGLTLSKLLAFNPGLDCTAPLAGHTLIVADGENQSILCSSLYHVKDGDSCASIQTAHAIAAAEFRKANPLVDCSKLHAGQQICVQRLAARLTTVSDHVGRCGAVVETEDGCRTCDCIARKLSITIADLAELNPGLDCSLSSAPLPPRISVCISPFASGVSALNCSSIYRVKAGDTCAVIASAAGLTHVQLRHLNPGLQCDWPGLQVGQALCISPPLSSDYINLRPYLVAEGDTLTRIAATVHDECGAEASPSNICWYNRLHNCEALAANTTLQIPCKWPGVSRYCGCAAGTRVCGYNGKSYSSLCDAICNYATPIIPADRFGNCNACAIACEGRCFGAMNDIAYVVPNYCWAFAQYAPTCGYPPYPPITYSCQDYLVECQQCCWELGYGSLAFAIAAITSAEMTGIGSPSIGRYSAAAGPGQAGGAMFGAAASPFGASSSAFGTSTSANPFAASQQTANPFGGGASVTPFGQVAQQPGAGTSLFGGTGVPAFGASGTPAFASQTPGFGAAPPAANPFGAAPAFGATVQTPAFGTGTTSFGSPQQSFGGSPGGAPSAFGTPASSAVPAFGAFGATSSSVAAPIFGTTSVFGGGASTTSPFGQQSTPAFGSAATSAFGTTSFGAVPFGGTGRPGSRAQLYATTNDADSGTGAQAGKFISISAMPAYKLKSPEELRWEDYQASDKGGPNPMGQAPAGGGLFGQPQASPFGTALQFGATAAPPNPFGATASSSSLFGSSTTPAFGAPSTMPPFSSTSAFGSTTPSPFGASAPTFGSISTPAFGASTTPAFGSTSTPFGSTSAFGAPTSTPSIFGSSTTSTFGGGAFGSSTPAFGSTSAFPSSSPSSSPFGTTTNSIFGNMSLPSAPAPTFGSFGLGGASQPSAFGASAPAFGAPSSSSPFSSSLFGNTGAASSFGAFGAMTKPGGLGQSSATPTFANFGATAPSTGSTFSFANFGQSQPSSNFNIFGTSPTPSFGMPSFSTQPAVQTGLFAGTPPPVATPFGTLPAMPQLALTSRSPTQYGISSLPVTDKVATMRTSSLLTPRHVTTRSNVRVHARRQQSKSNLPKVSFFSEGEDMSAGAPKADVAFVPREKPRALFIRQPGPPKASPRASPQPNGNAKEKERSLAEAANHAEGDDRARRRASRGESSRRAEAEKGQPTDSQAPSAANGEAEKSPQKQQEGRPARTTDAVSHDHGSEGTGRQQDHMNGNLDKEEGANLRSVEGDDSEEPGTSRRGDEAFSGGKGTQVAEDGRQRTALPSLISEEYFTQPRLSELAAKERADPGYCSRVPNFVVGRRGYGHIKFLGETDVRGLDLEAIVQFNKCEVLVYMDEAAKPPVGDELNKAAEVALLQVHCVDRATGEHVKSGPQLESFVKKLIRKTGEQGAKFLSYSPEKGEWVFQVDHFSRYGLNTSDDDDGGGDDDGNEPTGSPRDEEALIPVGVAELSMDDTGGAELVHALPARLALDPQRIAQMRRLLFSADGETGTVEEQSSGQSGRAELTTKAQSRQMSVGGSRGTAKSKEHVTQWEVMEGMDKLSPSPWRERSLLAPPSNTIEDIHRPREQLAQAKRQRLQPSAGFVAATVPSVTEGRSSVVTDLGLFLGRSFRVGWGPGGVLVHSGSAMGTSSGLSSLVHIEKVALCEPAERDSMIAGLLVHREMLSTEAADEDEKDELGPTLLLRAPVRGVSLDRRRLPAVCNEHRSLVERELLEADFGSMPDRRLILRHRAMVWDLVDVLFAEHSRPVEDPSDSALLEAGWDGSGAQLPPSALNHEAEASRRRTLFSVWLQDNVGEQVERCLADLAKSGMGSASKAIFQYLTGHQLEEATGIAIEVGDVRLASIIALGGGLSASRADLKAQLAVWDVEGLKPPLIDGSRLRLYRLLAGQVDLATKDEEPLDWKRHLGLMLWYQLLPSTPLASVVTEYVASVRAGNAPPPLAMYVEEGGARSPSKTAPLDMAYHLMELHAQEAVRSADDVKEDDTKQSTAMLRSASYTSDQLDNALAWEVHAALQAIGAQSGEHLNGLHMGLADQLLAIGQCHWAIYVILHMPRSENFPYLHERAVETILTQYVEDWTNSEEQREALLDLHLPSPWMHSAEAMYYRYLGEHRNELHHLLEGGQLEEGHALFMTSVASTLFYSGKRPSESTVRQGRICKVSFTFLADESELRRILQRLEKQKDEIVHWRLGASIFVDYLYLRDSFRKDLAFFDEEMLEAGLVARCEALFQRLREPLAQWLTGNGLQLRAVYSSMADKIAGLLCTDGQLVQQGAASDEKLDLECMVLLAPVSMEYRSCQLQAAVSTFKSWLSCRPSIEEA